MKKWIIIAIAAILLSAIGFFAYQKYQSSQNTQTASAAYETVKVDFGTLTASIGATGTVRSNQSAILTWKTSGTVSEIFVTKGDLIDQGEILARLEQTSLPQNVILAQADLVNAQKQLDDLLESKTQQARALKAVEDAQQALDDANNPELAQARALQAIADAQKAVENAQRQVDYLSTTADQTDIDVAKAEVAIAEKNLERAEDLYAPYENKPESNLKRAQLLSNLAKAQQQYDAAVRKLNALQGTGSVTDKAVAIADLATAKAQLVEAQRDYERIKDGPTEGEIALLEAQLEDAQREWERLKDGPTEDDIASAQARVTAAEATISQAWVEAPFAGTITESYPIVGDQVSPQTPAFRLDDMSKMFIDLDVSEIDISRIEVGQPAAITFDAIRGKEYEGKVTEVGLVGKEKQGVVYYPVTVLITNVDEDILPGMTATVEIIIHSSDEALLVPNQAIRVINDSLVVYKLDSSGTLKAVEIQLGESSDTYSQVIGGALDQNDLIVLNPTMDTTTEELNFFSSNPEDMERMRELRNQFEGTAEGK